MEIFSRRDLKLEIKMMMDDFHFNHLISRSFIFLFRLQDQIKIMQVVVR